ncbi:unnamed protein product [Amoebophrya sp. A120]|nr:unnamed protein product [Amoebophrya sp. A120]|eukprot:GSA120T00018732001.1
MSALFARRHEAHSAGSSLRTRLFATSALLPIFSGPSLSSFTTSFAVAKTVQQRRAQKHASAAAATADDPRTPYYGIYSSGGGAIYVTAADKDTQGNSKENTDKTVFPEKAGELDSTKDMWVWLGAGGGSSWALHDTIYGISFENGGKLLKGQTGDLQRDPTDETKQHSMQAHGDLSVTLKDDGSAEMDIGGTGFGEKWVKAAPAAGTSTGSLAASSSEKQTGQRTKPVTAAASTTSCDQNPLVVFAMGCFWCAEEAMREVFSSDPCVASTIKSGLVGPTPAGGGEVTYANHLSLPEKYIEAVQFRTSTPYTPDVLYAFWTNIDPLDGSGQFQNKGESYVSGVYAQSAEQKTAAETSLGQVATALSKQPADIKTFIVEMASTDKFHPVEASQQNYFGQNPDQKPGQEAPRTMRLNELWTQGVTDALKSAMGMTTTSAGVALRGNKTTGGGPLLEATVDIDSAARGAEDAVAEATPESAFLSCPGCSGAEKPEQKPATATAAAAKDEHSSTNHADTVVMS